MMMMMMMDCGAPSWEWGSLWLDSRSTEHQWGKMYCESHLIIFLILKTPTGRGSVEMVMYASTNSPELVNQAVSKRKPLATVQLHPNGDKWKENKKGILQKSGTEFTSHRQKQKTTNHGEEMEILKKQEVFAKRNQRAKELKLNIYWQFCKWFLLYYLGHT